MRMRWVLRAGRLRREEGIARVDSPHIAPPSATSAASRHLHHDNSHQASRPLASKHFIIPAVVLYTSVSCLVLQRNIPIIDR